MIGVGLKKLVRTPVPKLPPSYLPQVLPGTTSDWVYILAGVPQGSILGHILYSFYYTLMILLTQYVNAIGLNVRLFLLTILVFLLLLKISLQQHLI